MDIQFDTNGRTVIEAGEFTIQLIAAKPSERPKKTRVYVSGEDDVDFSPAYAATELDRQTSGQGYVGRGYSPETDKLFDALNRQVVRNQRAVLAQARIAVPELDAILGNNTFGFSRHAGCSCSCSPGFVASGYLRVAGRAITDVFVTRTAAEVTA